MPGRFELELTHEQLLELCGAGRYRIEALDEYGRPLAEVATVNVGATAGEAAPELVANANVRMVATSDTRIMLETIAQMSRAHSESLQSLANAQADWIKTLATAKQIPRNGVISIPPQLAPAATEPQEAEPWWSHLLKPQALAALSGVARNLMSYFGPKTQPAEQPKRRNSALAQLADRAVANNETHAAGVSLESAFTRAFEQLHGKKPEQLAKPDDAQPSAEKSS
jgi:hypothetical protein